MPQTEGASTLGQTDVTLFTWSHIDCMLLVLGMIMYAALDHSIPSKFKGSIHYSYTRTLAISCKQTAC